METISAVEIAEKMGVSENTVYALIKTNGFPSIPVGSRYIVPRKAFESWFSDPVLIADYKRSRHEEAGA